MGSTLYTDDPNTPQPDKLPKGRKIVNHGEVQAGDLLWTPETMTWETAAPGEVDRPVTAFKAVAR